MTTITNLKVAHAFFNGARGEAGGAPSKDSIVGMATIGNTLVTFGGRRGGTLKFHTHRKNEVEGVAAWFEKKLTGFPFGKKIDARYDELTKAKDRKTLLGEGFEAELVTAFNKAKRAGKLNINTRVAKEVADEAAE